LSTVKSMKMLSNLMWGLLPYQKHLLYRTCILSITLYGFSLWHYNNALLLYSLNKLKEMQHRAAIWILGAFHTLPSMRIKTITGLIPIHLHLHKLSGRNQLWASTLPYNYVLNILLESRFSPKSQHYCFSLDHMTAKQWNNIQ